MKKFALIFSSLLMLFVLAGCGNNNSNSSAKSSNSSVKSSTSDNSSTDDSDSNGYDDLASSDVNNKDYETGITYNQIARKPDSYKYKNISFKGKVLQSLDGKDQTQFRVAVNGDSDNVIMCFIRNENLHGSRILEGDNVTMYGQSSDLAKYKSTMGEPIAIPSMVVYKLDDKGTAPDDYGE